MSGSAGELGSGFPPGLSGFEKLRLLAQRLEERWPTPIPLPTLTLIESPGRVRTSKRRASLALVGKAADDA